MKEIGVLLIAMVIVSCQPAEKEEPKETLKDLGEIMIEMKVYHRNIGDHLRLGQLKESEWLVEGMDSTLHLAIAKFVDHPKLEGSFGSFYDELLAQPIVELREAIESNNKDVAIESFKTLTNNCNSCHKKHKVDKRAKFNP